MRPKARFLVKEKGIRAGRLVKGVAADENCRREKPEGAQVRLPWGVEASIRMASLLGILDIIVRTNSSTFRKRSFVHGVCRLL